LSALAEILEGADKLGAYFMATAPDHFVSAILASSIRILEVQNKFVVNISAADVQPNAVGRNIGCDTAECVSTNPELDSSHFPNGGPRTSTLIYVV
jgi:hypothetical protein